MWLLPDIRTEVVLRDQAGGAYRGEVLTVRGPNVVLAPLEPAVEPPPSGTRLLVTWPDARGLVCLPVLFAEALDHDGQANWVVEAVGESWREQRRQHVRAAIDAQMRIVYAFADGDITVGAHLIDLSEVGLRCAVEAENDALCVASTPVKVHLDLGSDQIEVDGKVLYGRPGARRDGRLEVAVLFNRPVPEAARIREHVNAGRDESAEAKVIPLPNHPPAPE
ncbi:MAG: PilZ protein [Frankiales bacterium]|nr:PilZ protein [Frankiales bacterium]